MRDTNASSTAFGWEFQSNAAIVLMLKNIKRAISVKVEGKTEDIEIVLENGKTIYSQAKSVFKPDDYTHVREKLQAGLRTLNEASRQSNVEKLIYITNSPNPFNDISTMPFFYGSSSYDFNELPDSCQLVIANILADQSYDSIKTDQLSVYVLPFYGDGENRYKVIKESVYEFLHMVGIDNSGLGQEILETWQRSFSINASQHDCTASITKKQLVWPVIVSKCELRKDDGALSEYDEGQIEEITNRYREVICNNTERFEFITKVVSDFSTFTAPAGKKRMDVFVETQWRKYETDFDIIGDSPEVVEVILKLAVYKVLQTRFTIVNIRGAINL